MILLQTQNSEIIPRLCSVISVDELGRKPIMTCVKLWTSIFSNILLEDEEMMRDEEELRKRN